MGTKVNRLDCKVTEFHVRTSKGDYELEAAIRIIGNDVLVALWGGDKPHIGAVATAQSQTSIVNPDKINATASVICFPGHKEDRMVKPMAEKIALATGANVVVTAGTHWDDIDESGIKKVIQNSEILTDLIIAELSNKQK
ncbi:MAG: hypothetical protein H8E61_01890 [Bacteroidetes bacterium]|nr:hypothetical protein [Bacteroidota bacterium]